MRGSAWLFQQHGEPMVPAELVHEPKAGEVVVETAGCGVCHTDLGFVYDGVPTRHPLPLVLGHEVSGRVVATGVGAERWHDQQVIVPAVIPCGACEACTAGHGSICPHQVFPGNDVHGGFGSHLTVPAVGLCSVPDLDEPEANPLGIRLPALSVIADAISTPYQAILRSGLQGGDLAVFVGAGGVGAFGVQIAAAKNAYVVAIDIDPQRLELVRHHGANWLLNARELSFKDLREAVRDHASTHHVPSFRWRIFETSGTAAGQSTAFGLLGHGSHLSVVGYTPDKVELRLANLMALDATARGNWGCLPEHYPAVLDLVLGGQVAVEPFVEYRPLGSINEVFQNLHARRIHKRVILTPDN